MAGERLATPGVCNETVCDQSFLDGSTSLTYPRSKDQSDRQFTEITKANSVRYSKAPSLAYEDTVPVRSAETHFEFDDEVVNSAAYRRAFASYNSRTAELKAADLWPIFAYKMS